MKKERIIINASNLKKGGALQVALSFIKEAAKIEGMDFHIFLSPSMEDLVDETLRQCANCYFYDIKIIPTESLSSLRAFRKKLTNLEYDIQPKGIITVFGQCYWKPKALHIMGFANPYLIYKDSPFFEKRRAPGGIKLIAKNIIHTLLSKSEANFYWTETEDAKKRIARLFKTPLSSVIVASNNYGNFFSEKKYEQFKGLEKTGKFRLIYISSYYPHKNFEFIPRVLDILEQKDFDCECVITINRDDYNYLKELQHKRIINIGPVHPKYCPYLYQVSDAVFMPTLLEVFSAGYPEAMFMEKPIITSDLPFAKDICRDAASYYDYNSAEAAAEKIAEIITSKERRSMLIKNGKDRLKSFDSAEKRFAKILNKVTISQI